MNQRNKAFNASVGIAEGKKADVVKIPDWNHIDKLVVAIASYGKSRVEPPGCSEVRRLMTLRKRSGSPVFNGLRLFFFRRTPKRERSASLR